MPATSARRPELLLFLHIPKASGSTMHGILDREYRGRPTWTQMWPSEEEIGRLPLRERASLELIKGHFHFGLHRLFPQSTAYITLVRDPVERVISHYYYVLRHPEHDLYQRVVDGNLKLRDYVTAGLSDELENGQLRLLSERARGRAACDRACLDEAKRNLDEHFPVVGVTERFDESVLLFQRAFGWRVPLYARSNVRSRDTRAPVDDETRELILDRNRLDQALYESVVERLDTTVASAGEELQRALRRFRRVNAPVSVLAPPTRRLRRALRTR